MKRFSLALAALLTSSALGLGFAMPNDPVSGTETVAAEAIELTDEAPENTAAELPVYAGYEADWQNAHDAMIVRVVEDFNAEHGWTDGHPDRLDPALVKAWALQESGSHREIFTGGDMMQMNNAGDWAPEKVHFGVQKGQRLSPEESLRAGLKWAYAKGEETRQGTPDGEWTPAVRDGVAVDGYVSRFTNWERALTRYNGGGVPDYFGDIARRMDAVA